ncbi:MAG TPA: high-affinity nickel-transport family protein [Polyangiaceae bacterium]|nr:high-affinity nickel-transport family protein [Polyangiaceae bacterium]
MTDLLSLLGIGILLGIRHATDPDHVVAVTAIVSRERTLRSAILVGALWGLGHTATILAVGTAIVLFGLVIPPRLGLSMELSVAIMLVLLGVLNLTGAFRDARAHSHEHGEDHHVHRAAPFGAIGVPAFARPLVVGVVHGLAGSAAVALLVLATIRNAGLAVVYLAVFGLGTVLGMVFLTAAMAKPLTKAASWSPGGGLLLVRVTGVVSLSFGLFLAYRIGFVDGLFVGTPTWTPR